MGEKNYFFFMIERRVRGILIFNEYIDWAFVTG